MPLSAYLRLARQPAGRAACRFDGRFGDTRGRSGLARRCLPLPRDCAPERSSSRFSPTAVAAATAKAGYHDPGCSAEPRLSRLLSRPARARERSRARASRHAWHDGVAARQGRGALHALLAAPRDRVRLPVVYPFIVDDPGEAAPAKRRIGAVTLGHLTPPIDERRPARRGRRPARARGGILRCPGARTRGRADLVAREIRDRAREQRIGRRLRR